MGRYLLFLCLYWLYGSNGINKVLKQDNLFFTSWNENTLAFLESMYCIDKGYIFQHFDKFVFLVKVKNLNVLTDIINFAGNLNQTFFDVHNSKSFNIKEKPSVGVHVTYYVGRMKSPIVSFRPP